MVIIVAILIGFLSAFIGSLVGLGGGVILVPILLLFHEYVDAFAWATPQAIVGISLITMIFTGLSSTLTYFKMKRVDVKTGFVFLIGSIPGGILGSWLNQFVNATQFSMYFGMLMILIFLLMLVDRDKLKKKKQFDTTKAVRTFEIEGTTYQYRVPFIQAFLISLFVGMMSGMFGIGGGTISVPAMILLFGMPVQIAVGTSMFIIFFSSTISATTHIFLGNIVWAYVIFFIIGSFLGGTVGAKTSKRFKGKTLEWFLRIVIVITALRLILPALS